MAKTQIVYQTEVIVCKVEREWDEEENRWVEIDNEIIQGGIVWNGDLSECLEVMDLCQAMKIPF